MNELFSTPTLDQLQLIATHHTGDVTGREYHSQIGPYSPAGLCLCTDSCLLVGHASRRLTRYELDQIDAACASMVVGGEDAADDDTLYVLIEGKIPYCLQYDGAQLRFAPIAKHECRKFFYDGFIA